MNTTITIGEFILAIAFAGMAIVLYAAAKAAVQTWLK
jgi:hypothetical protein